MLLAAVVSLLSVSVTHFGHRFLFLIVSYPPPHIFDLIFRYQTFEGRIIMHPDHLDGGKIHPDDPNAKNRAPVYGSQEVLKLGMEWIIQAHNSF